MEVGHEVAAATQQAGCCRERIRKPRVTGKAKLQPALKEKKHDSEKEKLNFQGEDSGWQTHRPMLRGEILRRESNVSLRG